MTHHAHKHGLSRTHEYRVWQGIRHRCTNPKNPAWEDYGGRGITICDRWLNDPQAFIDDMGPCPPGHEIDRAKNDEGYAKDNCRWATRKVNDRNRRSNRVVEYRGEKRALVEWCEILNIDPAAMGHRLDLGWSPERAFETPIRAKSPKRTTKIACEICGADFLPRTQADGTTQRACPGACAKTLMVRRTAKLVPEQVVEIRRLHRGGASARSLAVRFGAGYTTIKKLLNGETWKTVPDAPTPSTAPGERGAEVRA